MVLLLLHFYQNYSESRQNDFGEFTIVSDTLEWLGLEDLIVGGAFVKLVKELVLGLNVNIDWPLDFTGPQLSLSNFGQVRSFDRTLRRLFDHACG